MERRYAAALRSGDRVDATFALRMKEMRAARTGEAYLVLELADRSGRIPGIMFRPTRDAQDVPSGVVVSVQGTVTEYRGLTRVSVESLRPATHYDARDIMPTGTADQRELMGRLRALVRGVAAPGLGAVLRAAFGDVAFMSRFKECPASADTHHAYLGGLLEHTVEVAALCTRLAATRPEIDRDLLVTSALLHDVGVVEAVRFETGIDSTDAGRLLGHAHLSASRVRAAVAAVGERIPVEQGLALEHVVACHHADADADADAGAGQARAPRTLEALCLAHADRFDIETARFIETAACAGLVGEAWTDSANPFGRALRVPSAAPAVGDSPAGRDARRSA